MKNTVLCSLFLVTAGVASAASAPSGLTGLWLFQSDATKLQAAVGTDLTTTSGNSGWMTGPWTVIGTESNPTLYSGNGIVQDVSWGYLTVPHGVAPNGGGTYVNNYTVLIDYNQTQSRDYNSLFQTSVDGNATDGDLWIKGGEDQDGNPTFTGSTIGSGDLGYSAATFTANTWHRIVWSVENGNFFKVYIDGALFLDAPGMGVDGRYSLDTVFNLFADNSWEDAWGLVGTVAVWDHALSGQEVADMGGWLGGSPEPTALILQVPEPATLGLLGLGAFALLWRRRPARF